MAAPTFNAHQLSASEVREAVIERYIAAVDITLGDVVYADTSNQLHKALADSSAHAEALGIAVIADNFAGETVIKAGGTVGVVIHGPVWGFTGLLVGTRYYVDGSTAGALTDTAPTGGAYQFVVCFAQEAETMFVDPGTTTPVSHA